MAEKLVQDPLTGVYSRTMLSERLQEEFERARRYDIPLSLMLIDLDHFKSINDAFGHHRGDLVLIEFAQRLQILVRSTDLVFRYGGDEFVLLLPHTEVQQAHTIAQRLLEGVRSVPFQGEPPLKLTLSIGLGSYTKDFITSRELLDIADQRHYQAKRRGRDCIVYQDLPPGATVPLPEFSRLLERDRAVDALHNFLAELAENKRGVLRVMGLPGSGRSRFLEEMRQAARLHGYLVLDIQGKPTLRTRVYGALSEALRQWNLPSPWDGEEAFTMAIKQLLDDKSSQGLIVTIDDLPEIDRATLDLWRSIFFSAQFSQLAIVYTTSAMGTQRELHLDAPVRAALYLEPLSSDGVRIWVRHSLQWEAPQEFVRWLHGETGGRPKWIQQGLTYLVQEGILKPADTGWRYVQDLASLTLAERIAALINPPPNNLPSGLNDFVGRESELRQLKSLIEKEHMITLLGPGGIGKSRLAIQAAAESQEMFTNGVYFVRLASINNADLIIPTIAEALKFSFSGSQNPHDELLNYLRAKEVLLVLDNFEHLRDSTALLGDFQRLAPGVKILVTSRERLNLSGETILELHGLPTPQNGSHEDIKRSTAVQMFLYNARRADQDFDLTRSNGHAVAQICRLAEGMPLGIELASAWVGSFSPQEITTQIENTLGFLATDQPTLSERHRSLLAVFDSFWNLLSESEQSTLHQLAVFRNGFTGAMAHLVAGASPFFLDGLVAKAYLRRTPHGRYEMHQLLWQYANEKLLAYAPEASKAQRQHSEAFTAYVQQRETLLTNSRQALEEISADIENVRAAWLWAAANLKTFLLGQSMTGLALYFSFVGRPQEGETLFAEAVAHLRFHLNTSPDPDIQFLYGWLLVKQISFFRDIGMSEQALPALSEATALAKKNQDIHLEALINLERGRLLMRRDMTQARQPLEQALDLAQQIRSQEVSRVIPPFIQVEERFAQSIEAHCQRLLGTIAARGDNIATARDDLQNALRLQRELGDLDEEGKVLNNLGLVADMDGQRELAREYFMQALQIRRDLGRKVSSAIVLHNLGLVSFNLGDFAQAWEYYEQALAIWQDTGNWSSEGITLNNLSDIALAQGDVDRALNYAERAIDIHQLSGNKYARGEALEALARLYLYTGDYEQAKITLESAMGEYLEVGERNGEISTLARLGLLAHRLGDNETAQARLQHAQDLAKEIGNQRFLALACTYIGHVTLELQRYEDACLAYQQALELQESSGERHLTLEPRAGLAQCALVQADLPQALLQTRTILSYLESQHSLRAAGHAMDGVEDPVRVYLACYNVLREDNDPEAQEILMEAHKHLQVRLAMISDLQMQRSMLVNIPSHQKLDSTLQLLEDRNA